MPDKMSKKILRLLNRKSLTVEQLTAKLKIERGRIQWYVNELLKDEYIEYDGDNRPVGYQTAPKGKSIIENIMQDFWRWFIPVVISNVIAVSALVVSIIALNK